MIKIVALGGSIRPQSFAYQVLKLALEKAHEKAGEHQVETVLLDLRQLRLPFCDGGKDYPDYPDVEIFRETMRSATGILIATPEYHGSVSGVLKNALDLLDEEDIAGKVVALIAVMGGVYSTNALNVMRLICRQLHCWVLPDQLVIPYGNENFDEKGQLKDPQLVSRLEHMVSHLVKAAYKLSRS